MMAFDVREPAPKVVTIAKRLEGRPGTTLNLTTRRGAHERTFRLTRRQLL